ncbi:molecular chaperone DnaJ [Pacificimonas flava]|uniref:Chaperone protein DnaJ n=2 Tax=Pacificimonas TaxID=1960290 RepID=A0A219B166_9SPHN|nr:MULTISPECIES: molecular chaperone DnaJ [Pacificimonas]MBZ6379670.1 molecular chaperone DnaJ [Pacificimonas aurantium]OWV31866.1 molecular chaperone DnaJ [Pacificimonas flava]
MVEADYYEILGVSRDADGGALKSAYRKLAMKYHPDRNPGDAEAEQRFKACAEAYDVLKDPQKRAAYDRYGKSAFEQGGGGARGGGQGFGDFSDIFDNIFSEFMGGAGGGGRRQQRSRAVRGGDLRFDLELSLEEAFSGCEKTIEIDVAAKCESCDGTGAEPGATVEACPTCQGMGQVRVQQGMFLIERACPQCHGAGRVTSAVCHDCLGAGRVDREKQLRVKIPAGVDHGTRIRMSGEGEAGARGGPPGDLYIFVHLLPHEIFERDGTNLRVTVPVCITEAALGGEIDVPSIEGEMISMKISAGTQSGAEFRRRGRGMPGLSSSGRGDLIVEVDVETPTRLSKRQKELLEEFRGLEAERPSSPRSAGFFSKIRNKWDELAG